MVAVTVVAVTVVAVTVVAVTVVPVTVVAVTVVPVVWLVADVTVVVVVDEGQPPTTNVASPSQSAKQ